MTNWCWTYSFWKNFLNFLCRNTNISLISMETNSSHANSFQLYVNPLRELTLSRALVNTNPISLQAIIRNKCNNITITNKVMSTFSESDIIISVYFTIGSIICWISNHTHWMFISRTFSNQVCSNQNCICLSSSTRKISCGNRVTI